MVVSCLNFEIFINNFKWKGYFKHTVFSISGEYMQDYFDICVDFDSGERVNIENLSYGQPYKFEDEKIRIDIGSSIPIPVTVELLNNDSKIKSIEYYFTTRIKNYERVIIPETGRWYSNAMRLLTLWKAYRNLRSSVNYIRTPLYIFTGLDKYMGLAVGIIGENIETEFNIIEPVLNRALNVHVGKITVQIKRGTQDYPLLNRIVKNTPYTEYIYYGNSEISPKQSWMLTMRDFAMYQRKLYQLEDRYVRDSLQPIWCSWSDWHSNDMNEEVILENVEQGLKLGIKNYIIDDGWFGPGVDNDYDVPLNIGNWTPDPNKISDMKLLVSKIKKMGGNAIIWCAPHVLAKASDRYEERKKYLIHANNEDVLCDPLYYSFCFMCPEAREIMADICESFITQWDFDGAKYDFFNWVKDIRCENPNHHHDVDSMIEGLDKTFELIDERTRRHKKDYIVEMKQDYGTPFFSRWGTMMRSADSTFDPTMNMLKTLYIQSYTPYALNDYQNFTQYDTPEDVSVAILKMMALGIPGYSVSFKKLSEDQLFIIKKLNNWYVSILDNFKNYREPIDAEGAVIKLPCEKNDLFFITNNSEPITIKRDALVLNASYMTSVNLHNVSNLDFCCKVEDCFGKLVSQSDMKREQNLIHLSVPVGGSVKVESH